MKTFQILFVTLLLGLSFSACNDNNNDTPMFDENSLKQTKWSGTLVSYVDGKVDDNANIIFYFITDSRGNYDLPNTFFHNIEFNYSIDGKLLHINGRNKSFVNGDWILTNLGNNKLFFRKGLASNMEYYTLELTKDNFSRKN